MNEIRCDKCGALLKAGDIKKEKCWKCGETVIQEVELETNSEETVTPESGQDNQTTQENIVEAKSKENTVKSTRKSSLFNLKNLYILAAVVYGLSLFYSVLIGMEIYFYQPLIGFSWYLGPILLLIGFLFDKDYKSIKIPAIVALIGVGLCITHDFQVYIFEFMSWGIFWLVIQLSYLIFLIPLVIYGKTTAVKSLSILVIVFIVLNLLGKTILFSAIGFDRFINPDRPDWFLISSFSTHYYIYQEYQNILPYPIPLVLYTIHWSIQLGLLGLILSFSYIKEGILSIGGIISNSFKLGFNNIGSILSATVLWVLTAWIPYLNVGTTIAMLGIVVAISKNGTFSPTEIFSEKYRKNMGEFFLLVSFMIIGIASGYAFVIIPGIVISIAWSQSILLFIDKGYSPLESIKKSNDITYGEKWTIFVGYLSLVLILGLSIGLLITLAVNVDEILALLVGLIGYITFILVMIGCSAYIYGELNRNLTAENN